MKSMPNVKDLVDVVLLCVERVKLVDTEFITWTHDISEVVRSGVFMVRVVSYGYALRRGKIIGFSSITSLSGLDSDSLSPVICRIIFSDGRILEVRPEVELYRCLKELYPLIQIYRF